MSAPPPIAAPNPIAEFLKKFSSIPNAFVDDLFSMYDPDTAQTDPVVNLDAVAKWLGVRKGNLLATVRDGYVDGVDFQVSKVPNPNSSGKYGGNAYRRVLLTPDCFKRLCMRARGGKAEQVRTYFIQLEVLVIKYRRQMMEGMQQEIERLERAQASSTLRKKHDMSTQDPSGYLYVVRASEQRDSVFKIGRTNDLQRRLREHNASRAQDMEVVFVLRSHNIKAVEACIKATIRERRATGSVYREVYKIDIDTLKAIVSGCDGFQGLLKRHHSVPKPSKMTGGYYACVQQADMDV
jgi:predicted GIY-YIG superfamily endonuclease